MSGQPATTGGARTAARYAAFGMGLVGFAGIALAMSLYVWDRRDLAERARVESYYLRSSSVAANLAEDLATLRAGLSEAEATGRDAAGALPSIAAARAAARVEIRELQGIQRQAGMPDIEPILQAAVSRFDRFDSLVSEGAAGSAADVGELSGALQSLSLAIDQLRRLHAIGQTEHLASVAASSARRDRIVALSAGLFAAVVVAIGLSTLALLRRILAREEELRASLERARRMQERGLKMEALGRLAGGVAHDFNNLLTIMLANAEQIRVAVDGGSQVTRETDSILRAVDQAAALTRQLLSFSRSERSAPRAIDLNRLVADMEILLSRMLGGRCALIVDLAPDLASVRVDPREIERVLLNLVSNAGHAMPSGGTVTIETGNARTGLPVDAPAPSGSELELRDCARLTVYDTGGGMDEETLDRAFEPFFTTKEEDGGTGLGLATVHGMITKAGGRVEVESRVGVGTRVDVYLPRRAVDESDETNPARRSGREEASAAILLVEDEDKIRQATAAALRDAGYAVFEAHDGATALDLCRAHEGGIDLILTNVRMPGMTGPQLVDSAKALQPNARVLFMSGYAGGDLAAGGQLLSKPFRTQELLDAVHASLHG